MGSRKKLVTVHGLVMDCSTQGLSEAQIKEKSRVDEEYASFMKKFNESILSKNAEIIEQGTQITVYEIDRTPANFTKDVTISNSSANVVKPTSVSNSVILPSGSVVPSSGQPHTYQLVVNPRMGLIVTPSTPSANSTTAPTNTISSNSTGPVAASRVQPRVAHISPQIKRLPAPIPTPAPKISINPNTQKTTGALTKSNAAPAKVSTINTRSKAKPLTVRSQENSNTETKSPVTTIKGKTNANAVVDLTDDDTKPSASDCKEVSISRYPGRIYPSLVVVARPQLKSKEVTSALTQAERSSLDTRVKSILTNTPTKFTEWLIQQGLLRSEQVCNVHANTDGMPTKLKLGMYSDASKFPYSGGYVWISDCCPQKFVSVFCNSIFEGAPYAPTILLKLMYHWACQTNVHNVLSWVKVENLYMKNFFTSLRAVCTAAVCEKYGKLGGPGKKIEVGVISLGTTSQNGNIRQVRVEVLGIMDPVTKYVRLRAVDPVPNADKNHRLRFSRILECLTLWVHKSTTIITDYTVDKCTLNELGYALVIQTQPNSPVTPDNNQAIMDYLKCVVPRMFQNTLSLLSRSIIQQFLDELVWRERWGATATRAFDTLVAHLAEMTKLDTGDILVNRLKGITSNPFRDWSYKNWKMNNALSANPTVKNVGSSVAVKMPPTATNRCKQIGAKISPPVANKATKKSAGDSPNDTNDRLSSEVDDDNVPVSSTSSRRSRGAVALDDCRSNGGIVSSTPQVAVKPLESYYYGVLPPDLVVLGKLRKVELNMKCYICGLTYENNIRFMKHLAGHAQEEGAFTTDYQCPYCFKNYSTTFDLEDHVGNTHFPNKYNAMCLICGERFHDRCALVTHMQNSHVELELPYNCTICKHRCSEHTKAIDHFYEVHDGGERVQCPFCLKIVALVSNTDKKLNQNVVFYYKHIKRHQQKRKCPKCLLTFISKSLLSEHILKDHTSCISIPGILRYQASDYSLTLMPSVAQSLSSSGRKCKVTSPSVTAITSYRFDNVMSYPDDGTGKCIECKDEVKQLSQHFSSFLNCMKCMFATCCQNSMNQHTERFHEAKYKRKNAVRKNFPLPKPLYCVCGFTSSCGNKMAHHLVQCKRKIAYLNAEKAAQYSAQMQSASFPPLVEVDDGDGSVENASDKWLQAYAKKSISSDADEKKRAALSEKSAPSMLKELGLVRRESGSNDESSPVKRPHLDDTESEKTEGMTADEVKKTKHEERDESAEVASSEDESEPEDPDDAKSTCTDPKTQKEGAEMAGKGENEQTECSSKTDEVAQDDSSRDTCADTNERKEEAETVKKSEDELTKSSSKTDDSFSIDETHRAVEAIVAPSTTTSFEQRSPTKDAVLSQERVTSASDESAKLEERIESGRNEENDEIESATQSRKSDEDLQVENAQVELPVPAKEAINANESIQMETEEPSPIDENLDDANENSTAMECEENSSDDASKMMVDDPAPDAMMVD